MHLPVFLAGQFSAIEWYKPIVYCQQKHICAKYTGCFGRRLENPASEPQKHSSLIIRAIIDKNQAT